MPYRPARENRRDTRYSAANRGYGRRWRVARLHWLRRHPLCVMCGQKGLTVAAEVVDHIRPHKGDRVLFWDAGNWQSLCKRCHDAKTRRETSTGG